MKKSKVYYLNFLIISIMFSCVPQKKIEFMYNQTNQVEQYSTYSGTENVIKINDVLLVNVSSFDDVSFNYFENQDDGRIMQGANELSLTAMGYTVDESGNIRFPILGKVKLAGLNLEDASIKLEKALAPYFNQPNVNIKFAYKKLTLLGEVNSPGFHTYTKENLNIFEALGVANGVTVHGNIEKILLLRNDGEKSTSYKIDLTNKDCISKELYYVQPNDVIIVNPRKSAKWGIISTPISLTLTLITTTLLVIDYVSGN